MITITFEEKIMTGIFTKHRRTVIKGSMIMIGIHLTYESKHTKHSQK